CRSVGIPTELFWAAQLDHELARAAIYLYIPPEHRIPKCPRLYGVVAGWHQSVQLESAIWICISPGEYVLCGHLGSAGGYEANRDAGNWFTIGGRLDDPMNFKFGRAQCNSRTFSEGYWRVGVVLFYLGEHFLNELNRT